ncbi:hypothetical protein GCM10008986_27790 [Salinibacillus aidingensis]|uniref:HTH luxR-type domain-containing protein n=1 Tax=Salinibacillus aidingensis TaxID=237684 RepID=A0ABP3LEG1_9BACI
MAFKNSNQQNRIPSFHPSDYDFFIGREEELNELEELLTLPETSPYKMIYIHGIAGIGKTLLVRMLQYRLSLEELPFFTLDCRGLKAIPDLFTQSLEDILNNHSQSFPGFTQRQNKPFLLFIDHYDEENLIAEWIQEHVITEIPDDVKIILAGRNSLRGEWLASPAWQQSIQTIELKKLSFQEVKEYVKRRGFHQTSTIYKLWHFTKGHPLALSLFTAALVRDKSAELNFREQFEVIEYLVQAFLKEVERDPEFRYLLEISTILHSFNEEGLSYINNKEVSSLQFDRLVTLSFVRQGKNGWFLDPFIRQVMNEYFKHRHPQRFEEISKRAAAYYRQKIFSSSGRKNLEYYISEFIYHLGDDLIGTSLFDLAEGSNYRLETGSRHNFLEIAEYFEGRQGHAPNYEVDYYHPGTDQNHQFRVSSEHNQRENELIDVQTLKQLGYDVFKMLKDEKGKTVGISIVIPIHRKTIPTLKNMPVTRSYFNRLSVGELSELKVAEDEVAGWFIRMIDVHNPEDPVKRSYLLYRLMPLLLSGGRIIASTPLKMYQEMLQRLGFQQVKGATHFDYGPNVPSPTFILDVRGPRLVSYLDELASSLARQTNLNLPKKSLPFSPREFEVAELIVEGLTNGEIANRLSVSQITVKKHVSQLLKKMEVKNRAQLIRRLLDYVKESD